MYTRSQTDFSEEDGDEHSIAKLRRREHGLESSGQSNDNTAVMMLQIVQMMQANRAEAAKRDERDRAEAAKRDERHREEAAKRDEEAANETMGPAPREDIPSDDEPVHGEWHKRPE